MYKWIDPNYLSWSIFLGIYVPYGESIIAVDARPLTLPLRDIDVSTELDSIYEVSIYLYINIILDKEIMVIKRFKVVTVKIWNRSTINIIKCSYK